MKLNTSSFALAAAEAVGILYILCSLLVYFAPDLALKVTANMMHLINLDQFKSTLELSLQGVLIGLLEVVVYTFVATYLFAWLYNKQAE